MGFKTVLLGYYALRRGAYCEALMGDFGEFTAPNGLKLIFFVKQEDRTKRVEYNFTSPKRPKMHSWNIELILIKLCVDF